MYASKCSLICCVFIPPLARLNAGRNGFHVLGMVARRSFRPAEGEEGMVNKLAKAIEEERREGEGKASSHVRH